jgi:hypothetical protein
MIEELEPEELGMKAIEYLEPFCCGTKMRSIFTYRSVKSGIYRQFICETCKYYQSRCIAKPV